MIEAFYCIAKTALIALAVILAGYLLAEWLDLD